MSVDVVLDDGSDNRSGGSSWYITGFPSSQIESGIEGDTSRRYLTSLLNRYSLRAFLRVLDPKSRVAGCGRHIIPGKRYVSVRANGRQASVNNLAVCGLLWLCPVCASKITEVRRQEMKLALESAAKRFDFVTCLLTLTLPHQPYDKLRDLLDLEFRAWRSVTEGRSGIELRTYGWRHHIRAFEVTWGARSGWHPHLHVLLFCAPGTDLEALRGFIERKWLAVLAAAGRKGNEHAVDLRATDGDVWSYVAKFGRDDTAASAFWGVSGEMTKGHMKQGRKGRYSPFDILRAGQAGELALWLVRKVWSEYADAVKNRKQLVFSRGLKALLCIEELPDTEIAETAGEDMPELARLTYRQWRVIFNRNAVGDLLQAAMSPAPLSAIRDFLLAVGCEETSTWVV